MKVSKACFHRISKNKFVPSGNFLAWLSFYIGSALLTFKTIAMKKISLLVLALTTALALTQCKKEKPHQWNDPGPGSGGGGNNPISLDISKGHSVKVDILGKITDQAGNNLSGVTVNISGKSYTSNDDGIFIISEASAFSRFAYLEASKDGYFKGSRTFVPAEGVNHVEIMLLSKGTPVEFNATDGVVLKKSDMEVAFGNDFVDESGNAYTGKIKAYFEYLDPNNEDVFKQMPGDLRGVDQDGEQVLETYGMLVAELEGEQGQKIEPAEGSPATLRMPVSAERQAVADATIPLWHFNQEAGLWVQEGEAELINGYYVGKVGHFSFWNIDKPRLTTMLNANFVIDGDKIAPGVQFRLKCSSLPQVTRSITSASKLSGLVPANEVLDVDIVWNGEVVHSEQFTSPNGGTFDKTFNIPGINAVTVTGLVKDCNGALVESAYVMINGFETIKVVNGRYSFKSFKNNNVLYSAKALYLSGGYSSQISFKVDSDNPNIPDMILCPGGNTNQNPLEISFSIDGFSYTVFGKNLISEDDSLISFVGGKYAGDMSSSHSFRASFYKFGKWSNANQFTLPGSPFNGEFTFHNGVNGYYVKNMDIVINDRNPYNIEFSGTLQYYDSQQGKYLEVPITDGKIIEK